MFSNYALPQGAVERLSARGIQEPTPIQEQTLPHTLAGKDVLGRARTGTGKTLAFVLPIVTLCSPSRERARPPRALVLTPTRELARQVAREFEAVAPEFSTLAVYGGAPYGPQERDLSRGVDVIVGTPGRVIDHLERGNLDLSAIEIAVLDEADEMLSMGFSDAVERILAQTPKQRQTLLFSATIPAWVETLAAQYLRKPVVVDLVGDKVAVQSSTTRHIAVRVNPNARTKVLADLLAVHAPERAIVFTRTKKDADELALELIHRGIEADGIHGDLAQAQRERALGGFRAGRSRVLVATDVAARGLDIPEVDLVVQHHMPHDSEAYVHRSGRTGRAGRAGTAAVLYTDRENRALRTLEHQTGVFFERQAPPHPDEVQAASARNAASQLAGIPAEVLPAFRDEAEHLLTRLGADALAAALAWIAGVRVAPAPTSLLTGEEGVVTILLRPESSRLSVGRAVALLATVAELKSRQIGKVKPFAGGMVADVPAEIVDDLLAASPLDDVIVERAEVLPELLEEPKREVVSSGSRARGGFRSGRSNEGRGGFRERRRN